MRIDILCPVVVAWGHSNLYVYCKGVDTMNDRYRRRLQELRDAEARAELQGYYSEASVLRDRFGELVARGCRS